MKFIIRSFLLNSESQCWSEEINMSDKCRFYDGCFSMSCDFSQLQCFSVSGEQERPNSDK